MKVGYIIRYRRSEGRLAIKAIKWIAARFYCLAHGHKEDAAVKWPVACRCKRCGRTVLIP